MTIGDVEAVAGEKRLGHITASQADGSLTKIPVCVAAGPRDGPVLYAHAAQHGVELNGIEALRRVMGRLDAARLAGTLITVPIANPLALQHRRHFLGQEPEEPYSNEHPHNMNRVWPGDAEGNATERLAHALWQEAASRADVIVDIHGWCRWQSSAVAARGDHQPSVDLAYAFGLTFVSLSSARPPSPDTQRGRMLSLVAIRRGKTAITAELRGQWRLYEDSVQEGVRGVENCMRYLRMLPLAPVPAPYYIDLAQRATASVAAPCAGLFMPHVEPGADVAAGQMLGTLVDADTAQEIEITAPCHGTVYAIGALQGPSDVSLAAMHALAERGDEVARIYGTDRQYQPPPAGSTP
ncbi:MAG: succinylglutamate desuccinylase/aspartoacylase family protein [Armatimonadota bacterium]|jgi:predicted deacylase